MHTQECPICHQSLEAQVSSSGVISYQCDCAGFMRNVIEIIPPAQAEEARQAQGENQ